MEHADVVVVGAGIIGAACAEALTAAGRRVTVLDRGPLASATSAAGEGNLLVSDKRPGPELDLALASLRLWPAVLDRLGRDVEWEAKGGLVVGTGDPAPLRALAAAQRAAGVDARPLPPDAARQREPRLTPLVTGAVHYPQDAQLHPVLATMALLAAVRRRGGVLRPGVAALGLGPRGLRTSAGDIPCGAVVNAGGPWAGAVSRALGGPIDIRPRRGVVLVTAPRPPLVRHKVYDADYVGAVAADAADLRTSTVVEATPAGTILIGSSRERVGFDESPRVRVWRELARKAVALFPALADVPVLRAYGGFRPYAPDHLPVIGPDPRRPGLWHATGHEGAGIGLAAATGALVAQLLTGGTPLLDPAPFRVDRPGVLLCG
ncbi:FAD-dependent oxidoreductase [Pilimelia anulata]|uniref:FAD-dependent oxidoreductase n=1 Tax=Pilimelia anulata TaxID=53371 RepID=A0A8J3F7G9_9ACTN|nr:FAD-dependent oxidoreductase [Pilimelia anulata]GGJ78409.1 FAD-dependent oxidoreductase [Pilimelia anulata]